MRRGNGHYRVRGHRMHQSSRSLKKRFGEEGSSLAEFALVAVVFFTLLFGLLDFGYALYVYHFVSYAARDATRYAIVRGAACTTFNTACPAAASDVQNYLESTALPPGINPSNMTVTTTWPGGNPGCSGATNSPGCVVKVNVKYNFSSFIPFVPQVNSLMSSTSQMVISQ